MTPDRESLIERVCQGALDRDGAARAAFLAEACAGDAALQRDVESLLAQESAVAGFMSTPAAAVVVEAIGDGTSFIGRHLGPYVIHSRLGAGGMGEVYRAHDTKLGRDVAIKILPRIFTSDPDRLARFEREARLLASLNHPNIGAIYGLEDVDGVPSLVLELVEGETLQERLDAGDWGPGKLRPPGPSAQSHRALPLDEALSIARQIADALEVAHEKGIVHRDLKPANVKITSAGAVKVLDFGLARAMTGDASGPDLSQSPPITGDDSKEGRILGTPAYMSPGQARGRPVDKRADVWAFGCVLYEMLTGRLAFPGDTLSDTIACILRGEPDWRALPETTPAGIRRLLRRCLEKDPARRLRDIGDARLDIEEALTAPAQSQSVELPTTVRRWRMRAAWALVAIAAAAAIGALGVPYVRSTRVIDARAFRFTLPPPQNARIPADRPNAGILALSQDGRRLAFVAVRDRTTQLWVRPLEALDAQPLPDTEGAEFPIWSSDNRTVAFGANGKLKVIDVGGGSARTLCDLEGTIYGGSWTPDGRRIVFATLQRGLVSVAARDGLMTPLSNRDATSAETYLFPTILPDGRHFIYLSMPSKVAWLGTLDSKEMPVRLLNTDSQVQYVEPGYLVFVRRGMLMAQRFDAQRATLRGEAAQIVDGGVRSGNQSYSAAFATSLNGVLVYLKDPLTVSTQLTWVDRGGRLLGLAGNPGRYRNPELSPDGASVVLEVLDAQESGSPDVSRLDVARGVMTPLTSDPRDDVFPIWSPDGQSIMFGSDRDGGVLQLYRMRADGTGGEERVLQSPTAMLPQSWADRQPLIYQSRPAFNLGLLPLTGGAVPHLFDPSKAFQGFGQVSPSGRWLAYASTDGAPGSCTPAQTSGRCWNIYVQSFPRPELFKKRISKDGGASPRWGRDGREIFYYAQDGRLMAVPVTSSGSALEVGAAVPLFEASLLGGPQPLTSFKQQYDVANDGRFLLNRPVQNVTDEAFTVVVNWPAGLTQ